MKLNLEVTVQWLPMILFIFGLVSVTVAGLIINTVIGLFVLGACLIILSFMVGVGS